MKKLKVENKILIMLAFFSVSVGLWGNFRQLWLEDLCGIMYEIGLRYMFGLSAFFMIFQIGLAYKLIGMRHNRVKSNKVIERYVEMEK